ncbi:thiamin phosphate synthase [Klebsiella pneumoniae]|uniref:Thiamin phosphate synthase n=1 Tax=Klebsiella pneumoniae TaxID=573 RepID=A0A2X3FDH4_KLEPN|nr:thiamin phosphate synthase [Klebsiella pneumoniae]
MWYQQTLTLGPKSRGFIWSPTKSVARSAAVRGEGWPAAPPAPAYSASLTLNENCDPTVRYDMEQYFLNARTGQSPYEHDYEGPDDMPSHIKSSMLGVSLMLPVEDGRVRLGTWQGIWLGEHRIHGGSRRIVATLMGE